jgi:hypothetical protein
LVSGIREVNNFNKNNNDFKISDDSDTDEIIRKLNEFRMTCLEWGSGVSGQVGLVLSNYDIKGDFLLLFKLILGTKMIGSNSPFGQIFKLYC